MNEIFDELQYKIRELTIKRERSRKTTPQVNTKEDYRTILNLCLDIDNIIVENPLKKYIQYIKAVCYIELEDYFLAVPLLKELGYDELWISKQNDKLKDEIFAQNLRGEIEEDLLSNDCRSIFDCILEMMELLLVKEENLDICHYTNRVVTEKLIFDSSPFRMCSIITANDKKEGKVLYEYMKIIPLWKGEDVENNEYQCFVGCFILNKDHLNHFRLYGKENEKEATGVNICFDSQTFIASIKDKLSLRVQDGFRCDPLPLYRCMYIYPQHEGVISIGHAENENKTLAEVDALEKKLKKLKDLIKVFINSSDEQKNEVKKKVVSRMLMNLSCLTKHAAFKEEQECRIFSIKKLTGSKDVKYCSNSRKMYIEPSLPMNEIRQITFAPKASEYLLFKDRLALSDNKVTCKQSELPIA